MWSTKFRARPAIETAAAQISVAGARVIAIASTSAPGYPDLKMRSPAWLLGERRLFAKSSSAFRGTLALLTAVSPILCASCGMEQGTLLRFSPADAGADVSDAATGLDGADADAGLDDADADAGLDAADASDVVGDSGSVWRPSPELTWQIQLTGEVDTSLDVELYDVDLAVPEASLLELESAGRRIACFFSAGSLEPWREDADQFPDEAVGNPMQLYPTEHWLDVTNSQVKTLMIERLSTAQSQGCDAVQPSNLDGYVEDNGFGLTSEDYLAFALELAQAAHQRGLAFAWSSDPMLLNALGNQVDFALVTSCIDEGTCDAWAPLSDAGKAVLNVEFGDEDSADTICAAATEAGINTIIKNSDFDEFRLACP